MGPADRTVFAGLVYRAIAFACATICRRPLGRDVPLRWLFVFLVAISSYGILGLLAALIWLPMDFLVSTVAPQLPDEAPAIAAWLNPVLNYIHTWMRTWLHLVAALLMVVFTVAFTRSLWRRWPRIAGALST